MVLVPFLHKADTVKGKTVNTYSCVDALGVSDKSPKGNLRRLAAVVIQRQQLAGLGWE